MSYNSFLTETGIVYRKTTGTGQVIESWTEVEQIKCMVVNISPNEVSTEELRGMKIDYKVFVPKTIKTGDKIVVSGHNLIVKKIEDVALKGKVIICWVTKI